MPRCKICRTKCESRGIVTLCGAEACFAELARQAAEKQRKAKDRQIERARKKQKQKDTKRKKELRSRADWYKLIQKEVNWYAKHILYRGYPCYTCGKPQRAGDTPQAFHAGHYRSVGACPELRFEPRNIRVQCYSCNCANSGMRKEYRDALFAELGASELDWLDGQHQSLSDKFPTWQDLQAELDRWRKINKESKRDNKND